MLTDKNTGIQKFILNRITQINDEIIIKDPEYKELSEKVNEWNKKVAAKLAPEDKKIMDEQEGSWLAQMCRHEEIIYNEGLMDGILFGYWVALIGRGVEKVTV